MPSENSAKKILVTGSNGLLGQKLVYALRQQKDVSLVATSRGENRLKEKSGYVYESLDIADKEQVRNIIAKHAPDAIINTAAMTNVDGCETRREECRLINVTGVENIISSIKNLKLQTHLIHLSTDFVFDGNNGPYSETDTPNPLSYYAQSKYDSEKAVMNSEIPWTIIRTIIIYGVSENMSRLNLVLWALKSLRNGEKIRVVTDQYRAPTLAEDLADACISAALKNKTGIYHVSGMETMSIIQIATTVADYFKLDKNLIEPVTTSALNQPARRPPRTGFIIDKAARELNYRPHTLVQGLEIVKKQLVETGWLSASNN
jgi:dTDP-4-dehydrorhamnose reductase